MNQEKPDYVAFSLEELYDVRDWIDRDKYPGRLAEIELLIRDRERSKQRASRPQRVTLADEEGRIGSLKPGRMPALGRGIAEIFGAAMFAVIFVLASDNFDLPLVAVYVIAGFTLLSGVVAGGYHLYNAFSANRFSDQDVVSPGAEADPFSSALGYEPKSEKKDS